MFTNRWVKGSPALKHTNSVRKNDSIGGQQVVVLLILKAHLEHCQAESSNGKCSHITVQQSLLGVHEWTDRVPPHILTSHLSFPACVWTS